MNVFRIGEDKAEGRRLGQPGTESSNREQLMTNLGRELVQWVGLDGVDGQGVVAVNGSETGGD
jgi:hypothetical protein